MPWYVESLIYDITFLYEERRGVHLYAMKLKNKFLRAKKWKILQMENIAEFILMTIIYSFLRNLFLRSEQNLQK